MKKYFFFFLIMPSIGCGQLNNNKKDEIFKEQSPSIIPLTIEQINTINMTNTEKEILEVIKTWNDCFTRNDAETYFTYIHDDLTLFIPSSPYRIDGKQDDKEEFEWSLSKSRTKIHFFQELQPHIQVYDSTAIVTYYTRGAYGQDGNEQMHYLKETNVLHKENGKWKIVHIHVSK